jgi:hypothetical protein
MLSETRMLCVCACVSVCVGKCVCVMICEERGNVRVDGCNILL